MNNEEHEWFRRAIDPWIEGGNYPGIVAGLYDEDGKELLYYENNHRDVPVEDQFRRDTIFRIYSMTKPLTAMAIMLLVERGVLSLDDEVHRYIPSFREMTVLQGDGGSDADNPAVEPVQVHVTIRHLLTHTSGICYALGNSKLNDKILQQHLGTDLLSAYRDLPTVCLCDLIAHTPLSFQPGSGFEYGLSFDVLGRVIEVSTGRRLDEFFSIELFGPMEMQDTGFFVPPNKIHRLAKCYNYVQGHRYELSTQPERRRDELPINLAGGAGLVSTIGDYSRFLQTLMNDGMYRGQRVFSASSVQQVTQNQLPGIGSIRGLSSNRGFLEVDAAGYGFGLGVYVLTNPEEAPGGSLSGRGEFGWGGLASTGFYVDPHPDKRIYHIFMTQLLPSSAYPIRSHMRYVTHLLSQGSRASASSNARQTSLQQS